ncbi:MAG TPA: hypothetical protein VEK07_24305 [Polyangiaceae bacterium]|nr:hypothetical protein [Polyangiaceae bacterium]
MNARNLLAAFVLAGVVALARTARATPDFPAAVDQDLVLGSGWVETKVAPPDGCHLCHVNDPPAAPGPPMTAFGTLMLNDGATPYMAASTAGPALMAIQASNPRAIADIEKGTDPNTDPTALTNDPVPEYGCTSVSPGPPTGASGILLFGAFVLAFRLPHRSRAARFDRR